MFTIANKTTKMEEKGYSQYKYLVKKYTKTLLSIDEHRDFKEKLIGEKMSQRMYDRISNIQLTSSVEAGLSELIHIASCMPERLNVNFTHLINPKNEVIYAEIQKIILKKEEV